MDQHLLETEVETAEAWATYLAECFDSYRLIQHAGVYSIAGDCSGADTPWQVIRQLQKALKKKGLQWKWTHAFSSEDPTHAGDTARIFLALNSAPPIISDDMTVRGGPCRYAKGLVRTPSWNLHVAGWVYQDVCSANTVAPKPLRAEVTDSRRLEDATPGRQIPASPVQQHSAATASSIAQGTKRTGASSKAADARLSVLNRKRKGAGQLPVWAARAAVGLGLHQVLAHHVECAPPHTGTHRKIAQLVREVI